MKWLLTTGLTLLALGLPALTARAGEPCCAAGCASRTVFRIEEETEKYCVPVEVENKATVVEKTTTQKVPCTRLVPVCVTDPATGCTKTIMQEEVFFKEVKVTTLEVVPPPERFTCKTEERTRTHVRVHMATVPAEVGCASPAPPLAPLPPPK